MSEKVTVSVNEGKIRGIKEKSTFSGVEYYSFFGVPYAAPISDFSRFRDPVKVKPWKTIYDATKEKHGCIQYSLHLRKFVGSEDCLYNNIFTPQLPTAGEPLKPVIVNIHPGALYYGSPDKEQYGSPNFVMHQDVVYVSVGYRLHILGFLNLGIKQCSGNQALKDIILGLHWIRDNIQYFNGDPQNITLLGSSSGATIVHFLMLSPAAKGLFHKAILMGLYGFNPVLYYKGETATAAFSIAQEFGYKGKLEEKKRLLSFLKKVPASELPEYCGRYEREFLRREDFAPVYSNAVFSVTIDEGEQAVLPVEFRKLIPSMARVPIMFGICEREAIIGFCEGHWKEYTGKNFRKSYRQNIVGWAANLTDEELEIINNEIEAFYLNGDRIENAPTPVKIDIQTDVAFSDVYDTLIDLVAAELPSSVFVYKFQFEGELPTMKEHIAPVFPEKVSGTFHAADYAYWAGMAASPSIECSNMIETFTKLVTTFARNGNPNYEGITEVWRPSTIEKPCYMSINEPLKMVDGRLNDERMKFWHNLKKGFKKTENEF